MFTSTFLDFQECIGRFLIGFMSAHYFSVEMYFLNCFITNTCLKIIHFFTFRVLLFYKIKKRIVPCGVSKCSVSSSSKITVPRCSRENHS